jgi:hypothetical protein
MANVPALLTTLVQRLRWNLPVEGLGPAAVADALGDAELQALGHEILRAERKAHGAVDAPDSEAWDSLAASLYEALKSDQIEAQQVARSALIKRLKALAGDLRRKWIAILPVRGAIDVDTGVTNVLSTAESVRVVVAPSGNATELSDRLQQAFRYFQSTAPLRLPPSPTSALFITSVVGAEHPAIRQAVGKLATGRDALRFAVHVQSGDLGPLHHEEAGSSVSDVWLVERPGNLVVSRVARLGDVTLGSMIPALADPKMRKQFDATARVLEACPEGGKDRQELVWRLARSIRVFSRAVVESNRDLRFLLLLVAFEAVLSRKDSAIAESLSEVGALVARTEVDDRLDLARALKRAYDMRSRFVHAGQIPSERLGETELAQAEGVVFGAWVAVMRRLVTLADATVTDEVLFEGFTRLKFGASWFDAFASRLASGSSRTNNG